MIPLGKQPRLSPFKTKWLSTGCGGLAKGGGFMESRTGVGKPDGHPTCDEISLADGMKTHVSLREYRHPIDLQRTVESSGGKLPSRLTRHPAG